MNDVAALELPRQYNATTHFIDRHIKEGRGDNIAVIDANGSYSYAELAERVNRAGNALKELGAGQETRVMMCMVDGIDFPAVFWGAIKIGAVPVPVNTLLTSDDYDYMLSDSRARFLVVSDVFLDKFSSIVEKQPALEKVIVSGATHEYFPRLSELTSGVSDSLDAASTCNDEVAFWLYTSGSTGKPKGAMHLHRNLVQTAELYGRGVLGIQESDVVFSAAKLFFAYGLGNGMSFPFHVGATAVYYPGRPTPESVMEMLHEHQPTIFFGVPTLYGGILADDNNHRENSSAKLRLSASAGEALPAEIGKAWQDRFGTEVLDGIGSTEMLHIFLSNRTGDVHYGTTGVAVPGYSLKLVDEDGGEVAAGEIGELLVNGPSSAMSYWNQRDKSLNSFQGPWTRTGDKYTCDEAGYYHYTGRTDDMLKVGGIWVSPFEVESALMVHDAVLEAAVVAQTDEKDLVKPKAFVVLKEGNTASGDLEQALKDFVKSRLAMYKYPRWIEFVEELPKTATGKIQRFRLRQH